MVNLLGYPLETRFPSLEAVQSAEDKVAIAEALKVLDREFTGPAVPVDRVPLEDGPLAQRKQDEWLRKNGLG